jgi:hypothetical protein
MDHAGYVRTEATRFEVTAKGLDGVPLRHHPLSEKGALWNWLFCHPGGNQSV